MKCCPTCGRVVPPEGLQFSGAIRQRLYDLLRKRGELSGPDLHFGIWGHDPNGGPHLNVLRVHIWHLNRELRKHGLRVRKDYNQGPWKLCEIEGGDATRI